MDTTYIYPPLTSHGGFARFGTFDLRICLGNKVRFDNPQGIAIGRNSPNGGSIIYAVNSGQNVVVYSYPGYSVSWSGVRTPLSLSMFKKNPAGDKVLKIPWGIAADNTGNVYVVDRGNSRLVKLIYDDYAKGDGALKVSCFIGSPGSNPGQFLDPKGIIILAPGILAVVDNGLGRVTILDDSGRVIDYWEGLIEPLSIAAFREDLSRNFLVVIDSLARRVTKFDLEGNLLHRADAMNWGSPLTPELSYVAIDRYGQVLITDRNNGSIHKLDSNLNYMTNFGAHGNGESQFDQPRGVAIDSQTGKLVVLERERLQMMLVGVNVGVFEVRVVEDSTWRDLAIDFKTSEPAIVDLDLLNEYGQFIARIIEGRIYPAGTNHLAWGMTVPTTRPDGSPLVGLPPPCKAGERLPDGKYTLKGTFRATYGSKDVFTRVETANFILK